MLRKAVERSRITPMEAWIDVGAAIGTLCMVGKLLESYSEERNEP